MNADLLFSNLDLVVKLTQIKISFWDPQESSFSLQVVT